MWIFGNDYSKNAVVFGINNSLSPHVNNQKNNFLVIIALVQQKKTLLLI